LNHGSRYRFDWKFAGNPNPGAYPQAVRDREKVNLEVRDGQITLTPVKTVRQDGKSRSGWHPPGWLKMILSFMRIRWIWTPWRNA